MAVLISSQPDLSPGEMRSQARTSIKVRLASPGDADALQTYVRSLSPRSRYNRFLGALHELSQSDLDEMVHPGRANRYALVAEININATSAIVGEARFSFDNYAANVEFGLSVADRWQRCGLGSALLAEIERRALQLGSLSVVGDTLRTNVEMLGLARKTGFVFMPTPGDWRLMRFQKSPPELVIGTPPAIIPLIQHPAVAR